MSNPSKLTHSDELIASKESILDNKPERPHESASQKVKDAAKAGIRTKAERFAKQVEQNGNSNPAIHGAMDGYDLPPELLNTLDQVRMYRLRQIQRQLRKENLPGVILLNTVNTRYATDVVDQTLYSSHFETRFVYVPAEDGRLATVIDYAYLPFLSEGIPTSYPATPDDVFPAYYYFAAGQNAEMWADKFAALADRLTKEFAGGSNIVAVDGLSQLGVSAIERLPVVPGQGPYKVVDGQKAVQQARAIKSDLEIPFIQYCLDKVCQPSLKEVNDITDKLSGGETENFIFSKIAQKNLDEGGQWLEPRRVPSGERTWPELREASWKTLEKDELLSITTDVISCFGYQISCARTWIVNPTNTNPQLHEKYKALYKVAYEQIQHNIRNLKAGATFESLSRNAYAVPARYKANQTPIIYQGVGMSNEWPTIPNAGLWSKLGYDGVLAKGMVIGVQSYISDADENTVSPWGIRLETMVHVTDWGPVELLGYPYDAYLLS